MNLVQRHPYWALAAVAVLTSVVHTMDYHDMVAAEIKYVERPYSGCRLPDPLTEYRILIERRDDMDRLLQECVIVPRKREESPGATMQRLLNRKRTQT